MTAFTPATIEDAGRRGANLVQASTAGVSRADLKAKFDLGAQAYIRAGHDPARLEKALNCWVYVADSAAEARRATEESVMRFTRRNIHYFSNVAAVGEHDVSYEWLQQNGMVAHGTPDQVLRDLQKLQRDTGMTYPLLRMRCGGMDPKGLERSMRLFAQEVMPALRESAAPVAV
jgi:alkanesulfonate monooxygenase SsuD/methylene tetrahydromethanopterin reductase-like flavin-dependent oxidoreductase (luciferase family)